MVDFGKVLKALKPPKFSDIASAPTYVKEQMHKKEVNEIDVLYLSNDARSGSEVRGTIDRTPTVPLVRINTPEALAFFKTENCTFYNKTRGRDMMLVIDGYPFGLQVNSELEHDIENQARNDFAEGTAGTQGYEVPILIDRLPHKLVRQKFEQKLEEIKDYFELTPKLLRNLADANLTKDISESDRSTVIMSMIMGACVGGIAVAVIMAFAKGG